MLNKKVAPSTLPESECGFYPKERNASLEHDTECNKRTGTCCRVYATDLALDNG